MGSALNAGRRRLCRGSPARLLAAGTALTVGVTIAAAAAGWHLVSRPAPTLDAPHIASAAIESVAENLTDSVLAPLLSYAVLGLPGAVAYRAINTADAMRGYRAGSLEHFGKAAARLDDLLNLVPARLAALLLVLAASLGGGDARGAWRSMWRQHALTASPNAGWAMSAMAGALRVRLEKPDHYVLGQGRWPDLSDMKTSLRLLWIATALSAAGAILIAVLMSQV